jgi:acetyl-CoA carboxylase biotin carboxyl carrier protein
MNQKEIKELIEFLVEKDIAEFELQRGDMKLLIKRGASAQPAQVVQVAPAMVPGQTIAVASAPPAPPSSSTSATADAGGSASGPAPAPSAAAAEADLFILKSPIVGTFYEAPSPGAPPFVKLGEAVKEGQVLCIIEAMKLMNEIEADVSGVIAKIFVSNASPVEYGMPLFGIKRG